MGDKEHTVRLTVPEPRLEYKPTWRIKSRIPDSKIHLVPDPHFGEKRAFQLVGGERFDHLEITRCPANRRTDYCWVSNWKRICYDSVPTNCLILIRKSLIEKTRLYCTYIDTKVLDEIAKYTSIWNDQFFHIKGVCRDDIDWYPDLPEIRHYWGEETWGIKKAPGILTL